MTWLLVILLALAGVIALPYVQESRRKPMDQDARKTAPGAFVSLPQGVTHYQWLGPVRGPIAVCVHGLTTPSFVWQAMAQGLAGLGYRVLVYDLYGRGYSDRPDGEQDAAFFLSQLEALLDDQDVGDDFTLIGYSMGGAIATAFAARHPTRVRQLVLIAPAGMVTRQTGLTRFITETPRIGDWLMLLLFPRLHRKACAAERAGPGGVDAICDKQLRELEFQGYIPAVLASLRGILSHDQKGNHRVVRTASVPVLAIWARDDTVIPIRAMGVLAEWNRDARQEVVEGAGHGLVFTHTDAVLDAMRETLRDGLI